jgi:tetratricopeptide (TPR) repeat protein
MTDAVIVSTARTGLAKSWRGALNMTHGATLGGHVVKAALERASDKAGNARVTKLLGDAYRAAGDPERARAAYEKALGMEKRYPEARLALAALHRERKDWDRAAEEVERAIKDYGEGSGASAQAWLELADLEEARGSPPAQVERAYASALRADPQSCPALYWLGRRRAERKGGAYDPQLARQMLTDYLRVCPKGPRAQDAQRTLAGVR